jgi:hypothetical protein
MTCIDIGEPFATAAGSEVLTIGGGCGPRTPPLCQRNCAVRIDPETLSLRRSHRAKRRDFEVTFCRAYELCMFSELRNRLRAGDVWVDRSRQYQDFETYLIPEMTWSTI